ncbi:MAG: MFS transporter, partial [Chloroflexi bacterium]|nr:MFS transporter [Chloroflexota bacterium]
PAVPRGFWTALLAINALWTAAGVHRYLTSAYLGASTMLDDFQITATAAGLLAAIYFPIYGLTQLPSGVLADHRSPRQILAYSSLGLFASSLAFALAPTLEWAVVSRGLVGFASGFVWLASLKLFLLAGHERYSRLIGTIVVAGNLGGMLALLALPPLLGVWPWRALTVAAALPMLGLAAVFWLAPVPDVERAQSRFWRAMGDGLRACVVVLRDLRFWPIYLTAIMWNGAHFGLVTWLPRYARDALGQERATVGTLAALIPFGLVVAGYIAGWLYQRFGKRGAWLFYGSAALYTTLLVLLAVLGAGTSSPLLLYVVVLALGMLFSGFFASMSLLVNFVPPERLGAATGLLNGSSFGPAFATPWLMGFVLDLVDQPTAAPWTYSHAAFGAALGLLAVLTGTALLAAWWLHRLAQPIARRATQG